MKYLKTYEDINPKLDDLKKLLSHLITVFSEFGYDYKNYFDRSKYETNFFKNNVRSVGRELVSPVTPPGVLSFSDRLFDIIGNFSTSLIYLTIRLRGGSKDELVRFISDYFKTIDGLELYDDDKDFYETTFKINNVDEVINQISKEDIEEKFNANKFNL